MNAVEIEEAVSELVAQPFDDATFPFQFLEAFGAKKTAIDRLRRGDSNQSDVGGVLQRSNIHIAVAAPGEVGAAFAALRASPKTASQKAKFVLATDGATVEAEDLLSGEVIASPYADLPQKFAVFLPLAGISTVKEIKNNPIDVKATGRLNKLYVELLKDNPDWSTEERRHALNQFMARLIFCFFAEDTGIFRENQFTATITQMSHAGHGSGDEQWGNTHEVLAELFRAMDTPVTHDGNLDDRHRRAAGIRPYADIFPYVNGGLFTGIVECPRFSRTARAYLLRAGELDWKEINPDIFGSMIQAVADDGERGELGMHYTSVPNIMKVLNPLFLDDLRDALEAAGDSKQRLRNLRKRLSTIRVFDPACGSGNFLVIAYKEMRKVEAAIVERLGGEDNLKLDERRSVIPLSNFYGIEIKHFAAEIARLALLIAEFQADCLYLSQQEARAMVLPLHKTGQITVGNALRVDWLEVCPAVRPKTDIEQDLGGATGRLALEVNGLEDGPETKTYICGNPPYTGYNKQTPAQKEDIDLVFKGLASKYGNLDYVASWFAKAAKYNAANGSRSAFVSTNSICQGSQAPILWPVIFSLNQIIFLARSSFEWSNLAEKNAGITVIVVGIETGPSKKCSIFDEIRGNIERRDVKSIGPYLIANTDAIVQSQRYPIADLPEMSLGNHPYYGSELVLEKSKSDELIKIAPESAKFIRPYLGSSEIIRGEKRYCLWIEDAEAIAAAAIPALAARFERVRQTRAEKTNDATAKALVSKPYRFRDQLSSSNRMMVVPQVSSERREYLPVDILGPENIISFQAYAIMNSPIWAFSLICSKLHWNWIATVCRRMRTDFSYSNTLGWNTFPLPHLTLQDKADLTRTAESILLARETHFPATIADLYDPEAMDRDYPALRRAHEENDEVLERIYIGRRFRNDTERLEKLFELYTKMTAAGLLVGKRSKTRTN